MAICTYRRSKDCLDTLKHLAGVLPPDGEVLVIDQTPDSPLGESVRTLPLPVPIRYIHLSPPGMTPARNRALREARGRITIFLDDDVVASPELIPAHIKAYDDPAVGGVAGRVRHEWETASASPAEPVRDPVFGWTRVGFNHTTPMPIPTARGCNMSFRTRLLLALGGFDERLVVFRDDTDISFRVRALGYRVDFVPEADLLHLYSPHGGTRLEPDRHKDLRAMLRRERSFQRHFADDLYFILKHFRGQARWRLILWATRERYRQGYRLPHRLLACAQLLPALLRAAIRRVQPAKGLPIPSTAD